MDHPTVTAFPKYLPPERLEEYLEAAVDQHGILKVIEQLRDICHGKAEHLRYNWQAAEEAETWDYSGNYLDATCDKIVALQKGG